MNIQAREILAAVDYEYPQRHWAIWPDGKKEEIKSTDGNLYLGEAQITSLPKGLTVGGNLGLEGAQIASLPKGLTVGCDLLLSECDNIFSLPEDLTVGGVIMLYNTSIPKGQAPEHLIKKCIW